MVAINGKRQAMIEKLMTVLRPESVMLSVEPRQNAPDDGSLRPTVFVPLKRGETLTLRDVAAYKV